MEVVNLIKQLGFAGNEINKQPTGIQLDLMDLIPYNLGSAMFS
jgi:hypothetical protein